MALDARKRGWTRVIVCALGVLLSTCFTAQTTAAAAAKKGGSTMEKKMEHLMARGPIVTVVDSNFTRYAEGTSRPYHMVVLFTAAGSNYNCVACRMIEEPFVKAAKAYNQQHDIREENPVVFMRVDIASSSNAFQKLGIKTAPHVYLIPRGIAIPTEPKLSDFEFTRGLSKPDGNLDDFLHDFTAITGSEVVILPSSSGLVVAAVLMGVCMGIMGHFFADVPSRVVTVVRHRGVWFLASLMCYMTGVGGMIFCIIRNPKSHGFDQRTGAPMMFSPGAREQFWYEGVVVAFFYLFMSAAIIGVYTSAGAKRAPKMLRTVLTLVYLTVLCYASVEYFNLYAKKTTWYSLPQLLPAGVAELHKGPLKRKHGLLKRLVRLSHLWLNEYTGLEAFGTKVKTLLWDYIVRHVTATFSL